MGEGRTSHSRPAQIARGGVHGPAPSPLIHAGAQRKRWAKPHHCLLQVKKQVQRQRVSLVRASFSPSFTRALILPLTHPLVIPSLGHSLNKHMDSPNKHPLSTNDLCARSSTEEAEW